MRIPGEMTERYFVDHEIGPSHVSLEGPEAHHLAHVMRAKVGDEVTLFDGSGAEFLARIQHMGRSQARLEVLVRRPIDRELAFQLTLGVALPRGDRQRWLVEKATELGVGELVPLLTARTTARPDDGARARLERTVIEASKQCGRNRLMRIGEPCELASYLRNTPPDALRVVAHPLQAATERAARPGDLLRAPSVYVTVGPEAGFTDGEIELAIGHGWQLVDLGPRVLRVETAVLALGSVIVLGRCLFE